MFTTPCILFAGGKSSRMGEDKTLLPFGDFSTLTEYQYSKLSQIFQNVYIVTKNPQKFLFKANFLQDLEIFENSYAPTSGFITAFEKLSYEKIFVLSVDTPFVTATQIEHLFREDADTFDATVAKTPHGIETLCGIYHRSLLPSFWKMHQEKSHKLSLLLHNAKTHYVYFEEETPFLNLNHPQEYQKALLLLQH